MVMRLAQIAFRDLPQVNSESYTYDAFVQSIKDLGLHHQFPARGVTTVKGALAVGEAYLLASHMHRNCEQVARWSTVVITHQFLDLRRGSCNHGRQGCSPMEAVISYQER